MLDYISPQPVQRPSIFRLVLRIVTAVVLILVGMVWGAIVVAVMIEQMLRWQEGLFQQLLPLSLNILAVVAILIWGILTLLHTIQVLRGIRPGGQGWEQLTKWLGVIDHGQRPWL